MEIQNFILEFDNVEPNIDLDAIHGAFLKIGMDISTLCGQLENGYLALDITIYGDPSGLINAICLAKKLLRDARLSNVARGSLMNAGDSAFDAIFEEDKELAENLKIRADLMIALGEYIKKEFHWAEGGC